MFVLKHFIAGIAEVLDFALKAYLYIIIARAVLSWVNPDPYNPIVRFLTRATDPLLYWIRRRIPSVYGGLDLSPMIAMLGIMFLRVFLIPTLLDLISRIP